MESSIFNQLDTSLNSSLNSALKEWAITIKALEAGKTLLLLRKGGIKEVAGKFQIKYHRVLLYPTYEHQKLELLKPEYFQLDEVKSINSIKPSNSISINSWAEITNVFSLTNKSILEALSPYHIWNSEFLNKRFHWKPTQPLYLLLLRTYKLPQTFQIPYHQEYGGCKSWIDLMESISLQNSLPVFRDNDYNLQVEEIHKILRDIQ